MLLSRLSKLARSDLIKVNKCLLHKLNQGKMDTCQKKFKF